MNQDKLDVNILLGNLESELRREIEYREIDRPVMVGIHTGGAWVAKILHAKLGIDDPLGLLDISFYRDDFSRIGVNPEVKPSKLSGSIEGRDIILVDDVLYTGRTIRAALNEIFDFGRPSQVILATLIDRNGRQIPIQTDCVGAHVDLESDQRIKLTGPDPMDLRIFTIDSQAA